MWPAKSDMMGLDMMRRVSVGVGYTKRPDHAECSGRHLPAARPDGVDITEAGVAGGGLELILQAWPQTEIFVR